MINLNISGLSRIIGVLFLLISIFIQNFEGRITMILLAIFLTVNAGDFSHIKWVEGKDK